MPPLRYFVKLRLYSREPHTAQPSMQVQQYFRKTGTNCQLKINVQCGRAFQNNVRKAPHAPFLEKYCPKPTRSEVVEIQS